MLTDVCREILANFMQDFHRPALPYAKGVLNPKYRRKTIDEVAHVVVEMSTVIRVQILRLGEV